MSNMNANESQKAGTMSKTPFSNKCLILGTLWLNYREEAKANEDWSSFFSYNDIALPMSYMIAEGFLQPKDKEAVEEIIDETWEIFCEYINIDPDEHYEDIADAFDSSANPILDDTEEVSEELAEEENSE
jgi:hypothetical protein